MAIFFSVVVGIVLILFGLFLMFWTMACFVDHSNWLFRSGMLLATICFWAAIITGMVYLSKEENKKGPCVEYGTQMHYNPALKMMMPTKVCTKRGEWVNE